MSAVIVPFPGDRVFRSIAQRNAVTEEFNSCRASQPQLGASELWSLTMDVMAFCEAYNRIKAGKEAQA